MMKAAFTIPYSDPYFVNIEVCVLILVIGFLWALLKFNSRESFVKAVIVIYLLRVFGYILAYWRLFLSQHPDSFTDPFARLLIDFFAVVSLWGWLILLGGNDAYKKMGRLGVFVRMIATWAIVIPVDFLVLELRRNLPWLQNHTWVALLFPSGVVDFLTFAFAIGSVAVRYGKDSWLFVIVSTAYNALQIPAYLAGLNPRFESEHWIYYYPLAIGKIFNFVALWHLLLGPVGVKEFKPLIEWLKQYWTIGAVVAIVDCVSYFLLIAYPELHKNPLVIGCLGIFHVLAVWWAFREKTKHQVPTITTEIQSSKASSVD